MKSVITIIAVCICSTLTGQQVRIGLFRDQSINRITFSFNQGLYFVYGDTMLLDTICKNEFVDMSRAGSRVVLKKGTQDIGSFEKVYLVQDSLGASLTLTAKDPSLKQRKYEDDFEIFSGSSGLCIVNNADIDNYIAGVVESEGGVGRNIEYYKVQAIMSRTYLLKYRNKHAKDGFDLCDRVHCQAFLSMLRYSSTIDSAVMLTKNIVLVDNKDYLVDSYFHANCGGQTLEPQYIWNTSIPYLKSRIDTFCVYTKQAQWERRISQNEWAEFLVNNYNYPITDSIFSQAIFTFNQERRKAFYIDPVLGIPLRDIRDKFDLKSTYFSCYPENDQVVLKGRGYGHGVGLCQEGAIKMARIGFKAEEIICFYFPNVHLINIQIDRFYRQPKSMGY